MTSKHRSLTTFAIVLVIAAFAVPSIASAAPSRHRRHLLGRSE